MTDQLETDLRAMLAARASEYARSRTSRRLSGALRDRLPEE